jgi:hypothetical protein
MLMLPNSCFLHIPKTGGTWASRAIAASGIECEEYVADGTPHVNLANCPCPEKFKIAFVRHPLQFYQSFWRHKMKEGWDWNNVEERECHSDDFQVFVRNAVEKYPGFCGYYYECFVGPVGAEIEFIGRQENLVNDLVEALKQAGEDFDEDVVRNYPPQNVGDRANFDANYTPELEEAVRRSEWPAIRRFGYK